METKNKETLEEAYAKLVKAYEKLYEEKSDFKKRIDKAIEMFNDETLNKYYHGMSYEFEIDEFEKDFLKILKGEEND